MARIPSYKETTKSSSLLRIVLIYGMVKTLKND